MITLTDIQQAAERIRDIAHVTPVFHSRIFDQSVGKEVYFKGEHLQRTGSFKFRGAYNRLAQLNETERQRGIVAFSSGNHAQGVALAAQLLNIPATIVMPNNAPPVKIAATQSYGATIRLYDPASENREIIGRELANTFGLTLVPPFDDARVITGQGTGGLEFMHQVADLDTLVVPVGGGGLISGWAIAAKALNPAIRVIGVEPVGADDVYQSLQQGKIIKIAPPITIADGVRTPAPSELTFKLIQKYVDEIVLVDDQQILTALRWIMLYLKQVVEPTGALTTAAIMAGLSGGERIGTVLCGGNIAPEMIVSAFTHA